jgi:hypothetical protein
MSHGPWSSRTIFINTELSDNLYSLNRLRNNVSVHGWNEYKKNYDVYNCLQKSKVTYVTAWESSAARLDTRTWHHLSTVKQLYRMSYPATYTSLFKISEQFYTNTLPILHIKIHPQIAYWYREYFSVTLELFTIRTQMLSAKCHSVTNIV